MPEEPRIRWGIPQETGQLRNWRYGLMHESRHVENILEMAIPLAPTIPKMSTPIVVTYRTARTMNLIWEREEGEGYYS